MVAALLQTSCGGDDVVEPQLVKLIVLSKTSIVLQPNETETLTATVLPSEASNKNVKWHSSNDAVAEVNSSGRVTAKSLGECLVQCTATDGSGVKAECQVKVRERGLLSCPDDNHPHAIDLGLPSGTKWCCCNVGAISPEAKGDYLAWGETHENSMYSLDTYAYYNGNTGYINIGYDIAGTEYDAATVNMGAPWCMPSHEQQMELLNYCSRQWTQQSGAIWSNVNGILVTGPSGGHIFLPASGCRSDGHEYSRGSEGLFWSSTLEPDNIDFNGYAHYLSFRSDDWDASSMNLRDIGYSVRPVCVE